MIAIVDYGMGNVISVKKALKRLGYESKITCNKQDLNEAKSIILPGVGSFRVAMENLEKLDLIKFLKHEVLINNKPILGICLGMQLLASVGYEDGKTDGFGFIEGEVIKIEHPEIPIPHIGWNNISINENSVYSNIEDFNFYFVHSYHYKLKNDQYKIGTVDYGQALTAVIMKNKILGTQFHPEKSQDSGLLLMNNFLNKYA